MPDYLENIKADFSDLLNNAQIGIFRTRLADGKVLLFNHWLVKFLCGGDCGNIEEILSRATTLDYFESPEVRENIIASFVDDQVCNLEVPLRKRDGTRVLVSFSGRINRESGWIDGIVVDITGRKEAEQAYRESEAVHSSLFNNSYAIILLTDAGTGEIVDANPAACSFYGYPWQILTKTNLSDINGIPQAQLIRELSNMVDSGLYYYKHRLAGGEWRDVDVRRVPVKVKGRKLVYSIINDITERRRWETSLRQSEQQMADIIDFLPDATFAIDKNGIVIVWNQAAEELTGVKASQIVGRGDYEYSLALYDRRRPTLADLVMAPGSEDGAEYTDISREGSYLVAENFCSRAGKNGAHLWGKASCLYDSKGLIIGAIESVRDVTEHRRAEQAWRESEQRLSDIINFLPDPTFVIDLKGRVLAWNRAIEEMSGVPAADILGRENYQHALPFYGKRQPMLIDLVFQADPEAEKDYLFIQRDNEAIVAETPIPCVMGKKLFLWGKATPLYDSQGRLGGAIESIRDITQRKESEQALQNSFNRLEKILEGVVNALGATAEKRDPYTAGHQRRVAQLAVGIATEMNLPPAQINSIHIASSLHDIGKMHIPAEILSKPGELTEIERLLIKTHPQAGYDIVKAIPFDNPIARIIIQHHERLDRSGYPFGLPGSEIMLEARIVAVADVVEAMSSHRPYRPAFGVEKALQEIVRYKGTIYDSNVVDACVHVFRERGFVFK